MTLIKALQRRRFLVLALVVVCAAAAGVAVWNVSRIRAQASISKSTVNLLNSRPQALRRGVGTEVWFASRSAKPKQVSQSVESAVAFVYIRSGLLLSDEAKKSLLAAETSVLRGESPYIDVLQFTDTLSTVATDRLSTLTDAEINQAAADSSDEYGQIMARADGRWGVVSRKDMVQQARMGRDWSKRGDYGMRTAIYSLINDDVTDRVSALSEALPEHFGGEGLTPVQAFLIAYSVAADDPLTGSRSDIQQQMVQKRMETGQTREQKRALKDSGRPYGPHGVFHASAPAVFIDDAAIEAIVSLTKGGKG